MQLEEPINLESWKRRRQRTFNSFCVLACCLGTEYSIIIPSLWFYINDVIKENNSTTFYGLTLSVYYISAILGSFIITWVVDRTRRVKLTMLILIVCEIVGNILYSIPTSAYFPLFGRLIQGLGDINMSLVTAEIGRSFPAEEIGSKISILVTCFSITFVVAPAVNVVLKYIDVEVLGWHINFGNLPGIIMIILFIVVFIIVVLFVSDLSREYDLKETTTQVGSETPYASRAVAAHENRAVQSDFGEENRVEESTGRTMKASDADNAPTNANVVYKDNPGIKLLLANFDFVLLVSLGFLMSFSVVSFLDVAMPIYGKNFYNFSSQVTGLLFFANGVLFILVVNVTKRIKRISEYGYLMIGLALFALSTSFLLAVTFIQKSAHTLGIVFFCGYVLLLGVCWCVEQVFIRSLLTKLVPSSHQAFGEGVRRSVSSLACIVATLSVPHILDDLQYLCVVVLVATGCGMFLLHFRRSSLKNPSVIS